MLSYVCYILLTPQQTVAGLIPIGLAWLQGNTALMYASNSGCVELVGQLLAAGAGVDTQDFQVSLACKALPRFS